MAIIEGMDECSNAPGRVSTTLAEWAATPLGTYLFEREQRYFDHTVADIFGYYAPATVIADPHYLPFAENTFDLVVLPHALEFTDDPHLMLREAYRVTRPEGQIVIAGFNPFSLYGAKRYFGRQQTPPW